MTMEVSTNGYTNGNVESGRPQTNIQVDALIIGAGPAGASLACFLSAYGLKGLVVSRAAGTADTPRAHITNMAALECLRDIGVEEDCVQVSSHGDCMKHTRWCHSMAGDEYARIYSWGHDPMRKGDYDTASPCQPCDVPQTLLEPILIKHATSHGFMCRWNTSFVRFEDLGTGNGVVTTLLDDLTGQKYTVQSKYLFGADGARSRVYKQLGLPQISKPGGGIAINVLVKANLEDLMRYRQGNLHWVMQPDSPLQEFAQMAIVRMVKPWHEWMFILLPKPGWEGPEPSQEQYLKQVRSFIGDDTISAEILSISKWFINETVAEQYSRGNVFCLGDAVHRHPPFNGLGSNTCIQDSFNLAWKVAYVEHGSAGRSLLDTYNTERQPVGQSVVTRANDAFREHARVWDAIGILHEDLTARKSMFEELKSLSKAGKDRRAALQDAILNTCHEFHGLGIEMNQLYISKGIYTADEKDPFRLQGLPAEDPVLYHMRSTYPGHRLPHAWLNTRLPCHAPVSTIDLAGKGKFTIFTGVGGAVWRDVAESVMHKIAGLRIVVYLIGYGQQWEDIYHHWTTVREVEEDGAVLVRPDRFVAWRTQGSFPTTSDREAKLLLVMRNVLGFASG